MLNGNDEGSAAGIESFDGLPPLAPLTQGQDNWDDLLIDVESQAITGYAPSPYVPFRVQVKARDSIPNSELGNVPNLDVSKADDPKGDAGLLTPGQKSNSPQGITLASASVPDSASADSVSLSGGGSSGGDKTPALGSGLNGGDVIGPEPGLYASTTDLGLQEPVTPLGSSVDSDLVDNAPILGNEDVDSTLTLASADVTASSGTPGLGAGTGVGVSTVPPVRLTDPLFTASNGPLPNSGPVPGSLFATTIAAGDNIFLDSGSGSGSVVSNGASTQGPTSSEDSSTGTDGGSGNPNSQDESYLRNPVVDPNDPCNLVHGFDTPFDQCISSTSRTVLGPFKIPTVIRPDQDIAIDDVANLRL